MKIIDRILNLFFVPKCIVCGKLLPVDTKTPFCMICRTKWENEKTRNCPRCGRKIDNCWCGIVGDSEGVVDYEYHLSGYSSKSNSIGKLMVFRCKNKNDKLVFEMLALELSEKILDKIGTENTVIVNVPRSNIAKRLSGHDQTEILSKRISELTDIKYSNALIHIGDTVQKALNFKERAKNVRKSYAFNKEYKREIRGKRVILIDDVITTGATVVKCASLLKRNGADKVYAVSIAKTYI